MRRLSEVNSGIQRHGGKPWYPQEGSSSSILCDECDTELEYDDPRGVLDVDRRALTCPNCGWVGKQLG